MFYVFLLLMGSLLFLQNCKSKSNQKDYVENEASEYVIDSALANMPEPPELSESILGFWESKKDPNHFYFFDKEKLFTSTYNKGEKYSVRINDIVLENGEKIGIVSVDDKELVLKIGNQEHTFAKKQESKPTYKK